VQEAGLSVITYTGFSYDQILGKKRRSWQHLLSVTDLLVAGPYISSLDCKKPLAGSSNQELISLTGKIALPPGDSNDNTEDVEFTVSPDGNIIATGFPRYHFVRQLAFRSNGV